MKTMTATDILAGDLVRLAQDGADYRVTVTAAHPDLPDALLYTLRDITTGHEAEVTLTPQTPLYAQSTPRVREVPCGVCKTQYRVTYDPATTDAVPRAVLCGPCDRRTTAAVLGQN